MTLAERKEKNIKWPRCSPWPRRLFSVVCVGTRTFPSGYNRLATRRAAVSGAENREGRYEVPSRTVIRNVLIGVDPEQLDQALNAWNAQYGGMDESLAIDGKTMCNAIDETGRQTHIMSAIGHQSGQCYTQKKSGHSL